MGALGVRERATGVNEPMSHAWKSLIAVPYQCLIRSRTWLYEHGWFSRHRLPCPVVSVGNLTVGGTGKTPMAMWVANRLAERGKKVAILSRGYRRHSRQTFVLVSDGQSIVAGPHEAGDEPYLMARRCPGVVVAVGANRYQLGRWVLRQMSVDCFVLDDGFQHLSLDRDVNLLLIDSSDLDGLRTLLPAGRLREPLGAAKRASDIILTRVDDVSTIPRVVELLKAATGVGCHPVITRFAAHALVGASEVAARQPLATIQGKRAFIFSGVGNPKQFRRVVDTLGVRVVDECVLPDHVAYTASMLGALARRMERSHPDVALTTEKDLVKVQSRWSMAVPVLAVALTVEFVDGRSRLEEALSVL